MRVPISRVLAEVYTQYMEHKQLYTILIKYKIIGYVNIFIIYNQKTTNINKNKQRTHIKSLLKKNNITQLIFWILQYTRKEQN
jgi:hypothetical protein